MSVVNAGLFSVGNSILILDGDHKCGEQATVTVIAGNLLTLSVDLQNSYHAGLTGGGRNAAVAIPDVTGDGVPDAYDADFSLLQDAYGLTTDGSDGGTFVEFVLISQPCGFLPFAATLFGPANYANRSRIWGEIPPVRYHYVHLMCGFNSNIGWRGQADGGSWNVAMTFALYHPVGLSPRLADTIVHEIGHLLVGGAQTDGNGKHPYVRNHADTDWCVMDYRSDYEDSIVEFCVEESPAHIYDIRDWTYGALDD